jgi:hypothetical protein
MFVFVLLANILQAVHSIGEQIKVNTSTSPMNCILGFVLLKRKIFIFTL